MLVIFWFLFIIIAALGGSTVFRNPDELFVDIFMVFIFPFIVGGTISGISLVLTALIRQKWWVSISAIIVLFGTPILALAFTWIGSLIARAFYLPSDEDKNRVKRFLNMNIIPADNNEFLNPLLGQEKNESATKLFSSIQVVAAALLGGFLGGALLISLNHKRLKETEKAKKSLIITLTGWVIVSALSILLTGFVSLSQNPSILLISLIYPVIIYLWYKKSQKEQIDSLLTSKSAKSSSWLLVAFIGVVVPLIIQVITIFSLVWVLTANGIYPKWYSPRVP